MSDGLLLVLLTALGGLLIMGLGLFTFRVAEQRTSTTTAMPAAYRGDGQRGWRRGTLRFIAGRLVLKGPGGLSGGPWQRGNLDLGVAGPLDDDSAQQLGQAGMIQVPVTYDGTRFELALDEQHYTALRAWVEAVPPGWNSQVA